MSSTKHLAQILSLAAGLTLAVPAFAALVQNPGCDGGDKVEEKKKQKESIANPSCGEEDGKGKKGDEKS